MREALVLLQDLRPPRVLGEASYRTCARYYRGTRGRYLSGGDVVRDEDLEESHS